MIRKIIKVGTQHCGQCKVQERELLKLHSYLESKSIELSIVDAEEDEEFVEKHHIAGIPVTLVVDENDKELLRFTGIIKAEELKEQLEHF